MLRTELWQTCHCQRLSERVERYPRNIQKMLRRYALVHPKKQWSGIQLSSIFTRRRWCSSHGLVHQNGCSHTFFFQSIVRTTKSKQQSNSHFFLKAAQVSWREDRWIREESRGDRGSVGRMFVQQSATAVKINVIINSQKLCWKIFHN